MAGESAPRRPSPCWLLLSISGYASVYHNVLATASGSNASIHPSEPNYIWSEAGDNLSVPNDNDPFSASGPTNQSTTLHLSTLLRKAGKSWKFYQEDIDLQTDSDGKPTNLLLARRPMARSAGKPLRRL